MKRPFICHIRKWTLGEKNERGLTSFERKGLPKIFGLYENPTTEHFRPRTSNDLIELYMILLMGFNCQCWVKLDAVAGVRNYDILQAPA